MINRMRKEEGSILVMTVYLIAIVGLLLVTYISLSSSEIRIAYNHKNTASAFTIAEAGVERAIYNLKIDPAWRVDKLKEDIEGGLFIISVISNKTSVQDRMNKSKFKDNDDPGVEQQYTNSNWREIESIIINSTGYYQGCKRKLDVELNVFYYDLLLNQENKNDQFFDNEQCLPPWMPGTYSWYGGNGEYVFNINSWKEIYD